MIPELKNILEVLNEMAPFSIAEDWDNSGLQVGYFSQEVSKILVALDPTIEAVRNAFERKVQLLLTHHPLIFEPLLCINSERYPGNVVKEALIRKVSIVAVHTNLDAAKGGISDILANLFGLQDVEVIQEKNDLNNNGTGIGRIGYLPEPLRLSLVTETIKEVLGTARLMVMGPGDMEIRRIAVVGGSGGGMVSLASTKKADLLITGDIKHHDMLKAETLDLALIDSGHFQTERAAMFLFVDSLSDKLKEGGWDVHVEIYGDEKEPMRYE